MQTVQLSGSPRENVGRKDARGLRRSGQIPCVVYGAGDQVSLHLPEQALKKVIFSPHVYLIELQVEGKTKNVLIKETQFHPVTDRILHIDFIELVPGKAVKVELPLKPHGNAPGVAKGGSKIVHFRKLRVLATLESLVDFVSCDISTLEIGDKIRVKDLQVKDITILEEPNAVVVAVEASRASRKAEEAAAKEEKKK